MQLRIRRYKVVAEHAVTGAALGHTAHTISRQGERGFQRIRLLLFDGGNVTGGGGEGRGATTDSAIQGGCGACTNRFSARAYDLYNKPARRKRILANTVTTI